MSELREDLARALMDADEKWRGLPWSGLSPRVQKLFLRDADAALALIWPRAMEMAAGVAEEDTQNDWTDGVPRGYGIAAAIRNLEPPK